MTQQEFSQRFAATEANTEGYSSAQLASINDAVFAQAGELDCDDDRTKSLIDHMFERQFALIDAA